MSGEREITVMNKIRRFTDFLLNDGALFLMVMPGAILVLLFNYLPIGGIVLAFKNYAPVKGIWGSDWVGLKNFKAFFSTPDAWLITRNTIMYSVYFIVVGTILAVALALLLNELKKGFASKAYQTIGLLPHFLSYVIIAYLVYAFLGGEYGILNRSVLPLFGIEPISWYSEAKYWPFILTLVANWKEVGFSSVIYLAAIAGINIEYYEAARVDGASRWQQMKYVTLPCLRTIITIKLIMSVGSILGSDLGLFYNVPMNSGPLFSTTNVLSTYMYRGMSKVGFTTAAGVYCSVVGFILTILANAVARKIDYESALF